MGKESRKYAQLYKENDIGMKKRVVLQVGGSEARLTKKGWWEMTGAEMALWPRFESHQMSRKKILDSIIKNPEACSDFGMNWYPFRKEKTISGEPAGYPGRKGLQMQHRKLEMLIFFSV